MSCRDLVGSLLAEVLGELLTQGEDLSVESADLVVHVLDALVLGVGAGSFEARQARRGVTVSGDFEVEIGLAVEPGTRHAGGLGDGGHGEWESFFVEAADGGDGSLAGVS